LRLVGFPVAFFLGWEMGNGSLNFPEKSGQMV
jgi:hypothetical protein